MSQESGFLFKNFGFREVQVKFYSVSGGIASSIGVKTGEVCDPPHLWVLIGGGNDVTAATPKRISRIGEDYMTLARELVTRSGAQVILSQVLPRACPRFISYEEYAIRAAQVSAHFQKNQGNGVVYWQHRGLWNACEEYLAADGDILSLPADIYMRDGVHFNCLGNTRLYHSMRRAIGSALPGIV